MKKCLALTLIPLFFGCASQQLPKQEDVSVWVDDCPCMAYQTEAYREVKHPRIVEEISTKPSRRPCDDEKVIDCPCSSCDARYFAAYLEEEQALSQPTTYIPAQPEAYILLSNRVFNNFIKDTYDIYKEKPNLRLYVKEPVLKAADLPSGFDKGLETFKTQLKNSSTFQLIDNEDEADYILSTTIDWFDTPSKDVPAIRYILDLSDKDETNVGSWSEVVKKADNKSWL